MKVAIMQPYIFPYLGYFQLVESADLFVFYDDVNFIKKGWINRNRLLVNSEPSLFTVPLVKISQNRLINETRVSDLNDWKCKFYKTLSMAYSTTPFYKQTCDLVYQIVDGNHSTIADLAIASVKEVSDYLELDTQFKLSSLSYSNQRLKGSARLIDICLLEQSTQYINSIGGRELYDKQSFRKAGVSLSFLKPALRPYAQFQNEFCPGLSVIDALMFMGKDQIKSQLKNYELV